MIHLSVNITVLARRCGFVIVIKIKPINSINQQSTESREKLSMKLSVSPPDPDQLREESIVWSKQLGVGGTL